MDVLKLLEDVKNDKVSLEEAAKELKQLPYEDLGFAKLDHHRQIRSGFGEVVFCSGKSDEHLLKIYETFYKTDTEVLGTRASEHQYELVKAVIPEVTYDPLIPEKHSRYKTFLLILQIPLSLYLNYNRLLKAYKPE